MLLSGHTDVVPIDGQDWDTNPFTAVMKNDNVYGRGSADMKGFIACALVMTKKAADMPMPLTYPLYLYLSYDKENRLRGRQAHLNSAEQLNCPA